MNEYYLRHTHKYTTEYLHLLKKEDKKVSYSCSISGEVIDRNSFKKLAKSHNESAILNYCTHLQISRPTC